MAQDEALILQLSADIRRMERALNQARGTTNRQLTAVESRFDKMNAHIRRSGDQIGQDLRRSVASIGAILAIRGLTDAAARWTNLRNQVRGYSDVLGPVEQSTARLVQVANDAGVSVESLGVTFAASARAARTLGASSGDVFAFNEAVAKGAAIANTGAAALDGALTQLGQAIGSPKVQLGEFNSIIEGTPRLAQAFADGVAEAEGSVAKLRALIAKGDVSGAELFQGLLTQLPKLRAEFAQSETTVSRSMNRLGNAFLQYVGNADRASGVTRTLSGFIDAIAANFDTFADAALVAASVIGGALAVGAIGRLIVALRAMTISAASATGAMNRLRIAATFFTGPVGAAILGIGFALASVAGAALDAGGAMEQAQDSAAKLSDVNDQLKTDTDALADAQARLTKAIQTNSAAAQNAAVVEVEAIRKRIAANAQLATSERVRLLEAKRLREDEFRNKIPDNLGLGIVDTLLGNDGNWKSGRIPLQEAMRLMQETFARSGMDSTVPGIRAEIGRRAEAGPLNDKFRIFQDIITRFDQYEQDMAQIDNLLQAVGQMQAQGDVGSILFPTLEEGQAGTAAVRGYRTELEQLKETLEALRAGRQSDLDAESQGFMAHDSLLLSDETPDAARLAESARKLEELQKALGENIPRRSREVVQAILSYADATTDLASAFDQAAAASDLLTEPDRALLAANLTKRVTAELDRTAVGFEKLDRERAAAIKELMDLNKASVAAGLGQLDNLYSRLGAIHERFDDLKQDMLDIATDASLPQGFIPNGDYYMDRLPSLDIDSILDLTEAEEAAQRLREIMRESVKNAMREGIRTGDWGDSFSMILADAVTAALDKALDRVGDWLADFLFAEDGILSSLTSAAGSWAGSAIFGRGVGGPLYGGQTVMVGEHGPELLKMGRGQTGQVLSASLTRGLLSSGAGSGPVTVNAPFVVNGSVDAVSWPKVQKAFQDFAASVPGMVNATLSSNRIQKRRL